MSVHIVGSEEGTVDTGLYGETANFPYTSFLNAGGRRLGENRIALLRGATPTEKPGWNDLLYAHREMYDRNFPRSDVDPRLNTRRIGIKADALNGKKSSSLQTGATAQGTGAAVDARTTPEALAGPNATQTAGGIVVGAAGQFLLAGVGANNVGAQMLPLTDPGLFPGPYVAINVSTTVEMIRLFRFDATTWRIERVVASTPATEISVATTAAIDPPDSSAFGLRRDGTRCRAFVNGRMIADFTLNAAAQALAGTGVSFQALANSRHVVDNLEIFNRLS